MKNNKNKIIIFGIIIFTVLSIGVILFKNLSAKDINSIDDMNIDTTKDYDLDDERINWDNYSTYEIVFNNNKINSESDNIEINDNVVTIKESGNYEISGTLDAGNIIIDAKNQYINLILNNVNLTSSSSSPIMISEADLVLITLNDGTTNTITDSDNYEVDEDGEPNGTIFSKANLVISGNGTLNINANFEDGIVSKDLLKINSGTINVTSMDDGIRGKDAVIIKDGNITIDSESDGIKATNTTNSKLGYILIENGTFDLTTEMDGIQAETDLIIQNGTFNIKTGGGSSNSSDKDTWGMWGRGDPHRNDTSTSSDVSAKGLKASNNISITAGTFNLDTSDDAIHSNNYVAILDGNYDISSGDDGIHADKTVLIENGKINVTKSYEGLEAASVTINNGNIHLTSSDDGINVAGGNDGSAMGRPGEANTSSDTSQKLIINDGYVYVDASGDGLDANGSIYINGGTTIVDGPTNGGNGSLDFDRECVVENGTLIASGAVGMVQTPSNSSNIYTLNITLSSYQNANSIIHIEDESGNEVITYAPSKQYQSIIISSPLFENGKTYNIYTGGSYSNNSTDGLYQNGTYSGGTKLSSVTISNVITNVGNNRYDMGGNPPRR